MKNFDMFGYKPNFKAEKASNLHKTPLGFAISIFYVVISIIIIYACTAYSHFDIGSAPVAARRRLENIYTSY